MGRPKPSTKGDIWNKIGTGIGIVAVVISIVSTAVTVYYSNRNLEIMETQRKTSILPDISIQSPLTYKFYAKKIDKDSPIIISYECYGNYNPDSTQIEFDSTKLVRKNIFTGCSPFLKVFNGSTGITKNISIYWRYDRKKVERILVKEVEGIRFEHLSNGQISTSYKEQTFSLSFPISTTIKRIGFLKSNDEFLLQIPKDYTDAYLSYLFDRDKLYNNDFPYLYMDVIFYDIEGGKFQKSFAILPDKDMYGYNKDYRFADLNFTVKELIVNHSKK